MSAIKNRSEILFLYDVTDANPNGDPVDENKPRIDEETGVNIVTDVRLKRTVRDYLHYYKGLDVFVLEIRDSNGNLKTKEERIADFKDNADIVKKCIDVRLFGATIAVKDKTMTLTGPVQFKFGRSLHRVNMMYIKGTTVMPSQQDKKQGTFTEKYILPYSLIAFYGIVNENAAASQGIDLTEQDVMYLLEGLWNGTKNLISTSKAGQMPRLLLQVVHKEKNFHLGELDKRVKFVSDKNDEEIRDIKDGKLDITELVNALKNHKDTIEKINYKVNERVILMSDGVEVSIKDALAGFNLSELPF
ncbi:type I-B CRISPR-associated protein Cas7/Csh2 [Caldicoprobacter algeriensis]|uniref:type I-B CRISPR-associated protein Cas7/Csh2 n=1 Tax=Caldicoprobacter algeriensis TaxID=699281 RepID=UPI00207A7071|nr:type I-B CRISPR-associated protein Cas7/Csh2 [Caldicoprobacter algeriensis]MCM8901267.1 type I-B CRISPR-associated protein Cas7/Csh2 [Caldicoprobacter algeriensis]